MLFRSGSGYGNWMQQCGNGNQQGIHNNGGSNQQGGGNHNCGGNRQGGGNHNGSGNQQGGNQQSNGNHNNGGNHQGGNHNGGSNQQAGGNHGDRGQYKGVVTTHSLALRSAPYRGSQIIRYAHKGEVVSIFCKVRGEKVDGSPLWYLLTDGTWAWGPARHIDTLGSAPRWC